MTETKLHTHDLTKDADTRAKRAHERIHTPHETAAESPQEKSKAKHFDSSYQTMLFGSAGTMEKPAWSDSTKGRLAIRMFSRGILGAAAFTVAGRISRVQLLNYDPHTFEWEHMKTKPLQGIAKLFDEAFGKPIAAIAAKRVNTAGMTEEAAKLAKANAEWDATRFRTASYYHSAGGKLDHKGRPMNGRSLGAEMVAVSFDFAMMSVGDGAGRNLVQMVDPHIRKTWMLNDKGEKAKEGEKSHFSASKFAESWGRSAWRIVSKNQGEDWAVALPYVYQMRWQRKMLSKAFSNDKNGIKVVFDHAWNGAAYKVNNEGKIVGDYQLAGAMDLHGRFVGYNVLTLMFREGYDALGHTLKNWKEDHYKIHAPKHIDPIGGAKDAVRYGVKSFIKANIYMNPAVVPFWIMRVPQTKWRGALINTELNEGVNAIASTVSQDERMLNALKGEHHGTAHSHLIIPAKGKNPTIYNFNAAKHRVTPGNPDQKPFMYFGNDKYVNPMYEGHSYKDYEPGIGKTFSMMLKPFGDFSHWLGGKATHAANHWLPEGKLKDYMGVNETFLTNPHSRKISNDAGREVFMRNFVDASLAYTPYFMAKSELGLRVDDTPPSGGRGRMDNAIYKLIDNVVAVNPSKAGASVKEIWRLSTHRDKVIMREGSHNNPDGHTPALRVVPNTVVQPEGRVKDDETRPTVPQVSEIEGRDQRWAETVTQKDLAAQFQPNNSPTRH